VFAIGGKGGGELRKEGENALTDSWAQAPIKESFSRARKHDDTEGMMGQGGNEDRRAEFDAEATFMWRKTLHPLQT